MAANLQHISLQFLNAKRELPFEIVWCWNAGTLVHSFKFAADFDSPLEHMLAMSREFDLTHTWNRYVTESMILAEPSIFESTIYAASWLPFPFPHIDVVVTARGVDLADVRCQAAFVAASHHRVLLFCSGVSFAVLLCSSLFDSLLTDSVLCCAVLCCAWHHHISVCLLGMCSCAAFCPWHMQSCLRTDCCCSHSMLCRYLAHQEYSALISKPHPHR